ncbi:DNA replication and repair protein RecF [Peptoniphilus sp. KCTC 25270]|uniref:DNA replication/repair protein RecF n=1 Tax=Peptoniphilus sp. KCTC 25270 TaxID=2897414 RepID=UPI001E56CF57|nr:DNA replication and repair protein RecF [Peptoniphilus sp. KCTC 25270]MCD1147914.1 DNA replication and repair protein RecF [Peptoniphilus sp. KCTC 25270]
MKIKEMQLVSFRNYENETFTPSPGIHLISGENGRGKTNLLEGIGVSLSARSFRTTTIRDVIQHEKESAYVKTIIDLEGFDHTLEMSIRPGHRFLWRDNNKMKTIGEYKRGIGVVVFQPQDLNMVHSTPSLRRNFLDNAIRTIDGLYEENVKNYYHLISQRNFALKKHKREKNLFEVYDYQLAKIGSYILVERLKNIKKLNNWAKEAYGTISNQRDSFQMNYMSTLPISSDIKELEKMYHQLMRDNLYKDMEMGRTTIGPHLDDLRFQIDGKEAKSFASQGQIRSVVLSLKIAESLLIREALGSNPIVLFDDVFSELDPIRREKLLESFKGMQSFITMAEPIEKIFYKEQLEDIRPIKITEKGIEEYSF